VPSRPPSSMVPSPRPTTKLGRSPSLNPAVRDRDTSLRLGNPVLWCSDRDKSCDFSRSASSCTPRTVLDPLASYTLGRSHALDSGSSYSCWRGYTVWFPSQILSHESWSMTLWIGNNIQWISDGSHPPSPTIFSVDWTLVQHMSKPNRAQHNMVQGQIGPRSMDGPCLVPSLLADQH
jgi:hypothetical protein